MTAILGLPIRYGIRADLVERIVDGRLRPGEAVSPPVIAEQLGVSATPVREALVDLANEGFIATLPRRGFFVRSLTAEEVEEIYPLIWTIEALTLGDAPPGANDLDALNALNTAFAAAASPAEHVDLDRQWHRLLVGRTTKRAWLVLLDSLKQRAYRYELAYMRRSRAVPGSAEQHHQIVEALRAADLDRAVRVLEANWKIGPKFLLPWLAQTKERAFP